MVAAADVTDGISGESPQHGWDVQRQCYNGLTGFITAE
jgi:hypothetical protein